MPVLLKTNSSAYVFDPDNANLVLKPNGKFSSVYLGTKADDKTVVVIKKLKNPNDYRTSIRFQKESVTGFGYMGIAKTIDAHKDESGYYIIKEFIDGQTLRQLYRSNIPQSEMFFTKCIIAVLEILKQFHEKGIYHCDIRPDNIMVVNNKRGHPDYTTPDIRLIDFGLSKHADENFAGEHVPFSLIYSPPEQLLNYPELVDARCDLYSAGVTLYECLAQAPPFFNPHPEMVMHLQLNTSLVNDEGIDEKLFKVLQKATAKSKFKLPPAQLNRDEIIAAIKQGIESRYNSCNEMINELTTILPNLHSKKKTLFSKIFR